TPSSRAKRRTDGDACGLTTASPPPLPTRLAAGGAARAIDPAAGGTAAGDASTAGKASSTAGEASSTAGDTSSTATGAGGRSCGVGAEGPVGAPAGAAAGCGADTGCDGAAAPADASASSSRIDEPSATLSPTLTFSALT